MTTPRTQPPVLASLALAFTIAVVLSGMRASTATAFDPLKPVCGVVGWVSGIAGKVCGVVRHGDKVLSAGKKLLTGHVGGAAKSLLGGSASSTDAGGLGTRAAALVGLAAVGAWVLGGAKSALRDTAIVLDKTTRPQLTSTWFSSTYWRMAGISALLTLPFLFVASVQALIRSDLGLLVRAALGYLPLSLLAVSVAAPLTMLLLAASDEISAAVSSAAGGAGTRFLAQLGFVSGTLSVLSHSPFVAFLVGLLTVSAAIVLWVEMLMREAAVYIVVLMLPLAFAAFVWPARRVWAIRVIELLVALILSKFAIVAVLALGGAALGQRGSGGVGGMLAGLVLVLLAAAAPWALVRLLPMTELASAAAGGFRGEGWRLRGVHGAVDATASGAGDWAVSAASGMRRQAAEIPEVSVPDDASAFEAEKIRGSAQSADVTGNQTRQPASGAFTASAAGVGAEGAGVGADGLGGNPADPLASVSEDEPARTDRPTVKERLPGLADIYQHEDGTWPPIELGPEPFGDEPALWDRPPLTGGAQSPADGEEPGRPGVQ